MTIVAGVLTDTRHDQTEDAFTSGAKGQGRVQHLWDDHGNVLGTVTVEPLTHIRVVIKDNADFYFTTSVNSNISIRDLKKLIDEHWSLNSLSQLFYRGLVLDEYRTLSYYNLDSSQGPALITRAYTPVVNHYPVSYYSKQDSNCCNIL